MYQKQLYLWVLLTTVLHAHGIDNHHFYRASNFFYIYTEPRLERPWLTSFDAYVTHGSTDKSRGTCDSVACCKHHGSVDLLNTFGLTNTISLGSDVPGKNINDPVDITLINLSLLPISNEFFGKFAFKGTFSLTEANLFYTQNATKGFFFQSHIPVRDMSLSCTSTCDLSPCTSGCITPDNPEWQTFLHLFNATLKKYNLNIDGFHKRGIGDTSLLIGWTNTYQDTEVLDFIDTTIRLGLLLPTGEETSKNIIFDIPLGYNGHLGFPISFDIAFGALEWTTLGLHIGALSFKDTEKCLRLKTNFNQSGAITMAEGNARIDRGTLWDLSLYWKADHFAKGLSFLLGYTFARQQASSIKNICPAPCLPDTTISCNDCIFRGWTMHTFHLLIEYDFTKKHTLYGPRVGIVYNRQIGGHRVFKTNMLGASFGIDFGWKF